MYQPRRIASDDFNVSAQTGGNLGRSRDRRARIHEANDIDVMDGSEEAVSELKDIMGS